MTKNKNYPDATRMITPSDIMNIPDEIWKAEAAKSSLPPLSTSVSHPSHYNQGDVECIDALDSCGFGLDFCIGNTIKYCWRFKDKENPVEDLKKARWYLNHALDMLEKGEYVI